MVLYRFNVPTKVYFGRVILNNRSRGLIVEEKRPKISIILPVFNARKYLKKCMDSITGQSYRNLEIICIDDGSDDGSEQILDQYAERDRRIVVIHKKNGGESSARNAGLMRMTGQYVGFMDCDDWIEKDMYERLAAIIIKEKADMAISGWYCDTEKYSEKIENKQPVIKNIFDREELVHYLYKRDSYRSFAYMWDKLYSRELFYDETRNLMLFDEDLALGGDVLYLAKLAFNVKRACYIDKAFYHYNQRENSGCHTQDLKKREDWLKAYKRVLEYIELKQIDTEVIPWIKRFMAYHSSNVAEMSYNQKNAEVLSRCQEIMRKYEREYCTTNTQYPERIERYKKIEAYNIGDVK